MATAYSDSRATAEIGRKLGVVRLVAAGGVTAATIFALCWLGTLVPFGSPTHAYISLFTPAEVNSIGALVEGGVWSLLFGALSGGMFAVVYNLFVGLDRR